MSEEIIKASLVDIVSAFGEVFFEIGRFSADNESDTNGVVRAIQDYKDIRANFEGNPLVYDKEINNTLNTYPDLYSIPRV